MRHATQNGRKKEEILITVIGNIINKKKNFVIQWNPAHCRIIHNEYVYQQAKEAVIDGTDLDYSQIPLNAFKAHQNKEYKKEYKDTVIFAKAKWYKEAVNITTSESWLKTVKWNRCDIIRLRLGHASTNAKKCPNKSLFHTFVS